MNILKTFAAASVIAIASFGANASQIQSGGITWDPDYSEFSSDFFGGTVYKQYFVAGANNTSYQEGTPFTDNSSVALGDKVEGFGTFTVLNGQSPSEYCVTCTELTYSYTDFVVNDMTSVGAPLFTGGAAGFYVNDGDKLNGSSTFADASTGLMWLELEGKAINGSTINETNSSGDSGAYTYFDVIGGTAATNFDTNTLIGGSDLGYTASQLNGTDNGTANFTGNSIPEPTSLAIFGLGLLGLAGAARRKA
jgi:hypothetical protein